MPAIPAGTDPIARRPSSLALAVLSSERDPKSQRNVPASIAARSAAKYTITARAVPRCTETSNARSGAGQRSRKGTSTRCAEEETGTNSVSPWNRPSTAARNMRRSVAAEAHIAARRSGRFLSRGNRHRQVRESSGVSELLGRLGRHEEHHVAHTLEALGTTRQDR